jgi:hypothetical protein
MLDELPINVRVDARAGLVCLNGDARLQFCRGNGRYQHHQQRHCNREHSHATTPEGLIVNVISRSLKSGGISIRPAP